MIRSRPWPWVRPRKSAVPGVSRPPLPVRAKALMLPPRRENLASTLRNASPLLPATKPSLRSTSKSMFLVLLLGSPSPPRNLRFEETAAVEHVAAHRDLDDAVRTAFGFQRGLVAVRRRIGREVR